MADRETMEEAFKQALGNRVFECAVIPTSDINFSVDVLKACEANVCGKYNTCWTCPPVIGPMEQHKKKIRAFPWAFVFTTKGDLEDSFDYEGMIRAKDCHNRLSAEMHERFGKTNPVYGAGSCTLCESCAWPNPCRFPGKTIISVEAAGINVTDLSRTGNIKYNNGANTVTYFSMILF